MDRRDACYTGIKNIFTSAGGTVKVTKDKVENRQAYLTVEMEPAELEEGLTGAYNRLVKKANILAFARAKRRDHF